MSDNTQDTEQNVKIPDRFNTRYDSYMVQDEDLK